MSRTTETGKARTGPPHRAWRPILALTLATVLPQVAAASIGEPTEFSRDASILTSESLQGVVLLDDGSFITAGFQSDGSGDLVAVAMKYAPDATLDRTFGSDGITIIDAGTGDDYGWGLDVDPAGRVVVVGQTENGGADDAFVARLAADGSLDTTFSDDGILLIDRGSSEAIWRIHRASTGDLYAAGSTGNPYPWSNDASGFVARVDSTGSIVNEFGTSGVQEFKPGTAAVTDYAIYTSLAIVPDDGTLLVGGYMESSDTNNADVLLHAYDPIDGSFDTTFAGDGRLESADPGYEELWDVELQSDGTVVVAGFARNVDEDLVFVAAADATGTVDTGFGTSGSTVLDVGDSGDTTFDIEIDSSDRILMTGYASDAGGHQSTFIARFDANGRIDDAFGSDGIIRDSRSGGDSRYIDIAYDDDRMVSVGDADDDEDYLLDRQIGVVYSSDDAEDSRSGGGGSMSWALLAVGLLAFGRTLCRDA